MKLLRAVVRFALIATIGAVGPASSESQAQGPRSGHVGLRIGSSVSPVDPTALASAAPAVPSPYQPLYSFLDTKLTTFTNILPSSAPPFPTLYAGELAIANGNRTTGLLRANNMVGVILSLDRMQQMGLTAVRIAVNHSLLLPSFPNSAAYRAFYRSVVTEIRQRGLKVFINSGPLFPHAYPNGYAGMTFTQYKQDRLAAARTLLTDLQPDYFTVGGEPTTEASITGLSELNNPAKYHELISHITNNVDRGSTLLGAGIGTWEDPSYVTDHLVRLASLQYIDLDIYPINHDFLQRIDALNSAAKSNGKKLTFGQAWLYKSSDAELAAGVSYNKIFTRDAHSFWQPLDQKFIEMLVKLARTKQIDLIAPFWTAQFFAYLDYTPAYEFSQPAALRALLDGRAVNNMGLGVLSPTGETYQRLVRENRGTTGQACRLVSARWDIIPNRYLTAQGTMLKFSAIGSGDCNGRRVRVEVWERNVPPEPGVHSRASIQPPEIAMTGNGAVGSWVAEFLPDCNGLCNPPEYYLNATLDGGNSLRSGDPLIYVVGSQ